MKYFKATANTLVDTGVGSFGGALLMGGSLTPIGWVVAVTLFLGATLRIAIRIYELLPEAKSDKEGNPAEAQAPPADEKNSKKNDIETTATAQ